MKRRLLLLIFCLMSAAALGAVADWLTQVPAHERQKANPLARQPEAIQAGRLLYAEHCSKCHGENAEGGKKRPSLRSLRVQSEATEGDVHWLLVNGNLRHGMPSWSKLPDQQLWQLVSYLRSLKPGE